MRPLPGHRSVARSRRRVAELRKLARRHHLPNDDEAVLTEPVAELGVSHGGGHGGGGSDEGFAKLMARFREAGQEALIA